MALAQDGFHFKLHIQFSPGKLHRWIRHTKHCNRGVARIILHTSCPRIAKLNFYCALGGDIEYFIREVLFHFHSGSGLPDFGFGSCKKFWIRPDPDPQHWVMNSQKSRWDLSGVMSSSCCAPSLHLASKFFSLSGGATSLHLLTWLGILFQFSFNHSAGEEVPA